MPGSARWSFGSTCVEENSFSSVLVGRLHHVNVDRGMDWGRVCVGIERWIEVE